MSAYLVSYDARLIVIGPLSFEEVEERVSPGEFSSDCIIAELPLSSSASGGSMDDLKWIPLRQFIAAMHQEQKHQSADYQFTFAGSIFIGLAVGALAAFATAQIEFWSTSQNHISNGDRELFWLDLFLQHGLLVGAIAGTVAGIVGYRLLNRRVGIW